MEKHPARQDPARMQGPKAEEDEVPGRNHPYCSLLVQEQQCPSGPCPRVMTHSDVPLPLI